MADDKRRTPHQGVIIERGRGVDPTVESERARSRERLYGGREGEDTPVDTPVPLQLVRIGERTKSITTNTDDIVRRVGHLETGLGDTRVELAAVATQVVALDSKVDVLVEEAQHTRREREEREKRAETRAEAELERRSKRNLSIVAIVVPTVAAIGAAIAGIIAATREPSVKYVPTPPAASSPAPVQR